jgi:hypothetical protein
MKIYLYIKQHNKTKLKYFGKTIHDPYSYKGSGKYWKKHIKKHGNDEVTTLNVWQFDNIDKCTQFALNFSRENNIVESTEWANLQLENGLDGGAPDHGRFKGMTYEEIYGAEKAAELRKSRSQSNSFRGITEETKRKIGKANKGKLVGKNNPMYGKTHSEETKRKLSLHGGQKWSKELRLKLATQKSHGTYITPWGSFISSRQACKHQDSFIKDPNTIRDFCKNTTKKRKRYKNQTSYDLGFSFIDSV